MAVVNSESLREIYVWGIRATSRIVWDELAIIIPVVIVISIIFYAMSSKLDVMYPMDRNALSLGIKTKVFRLVIMVHVSLLTAVVVLLLRDDRIRRTVDTSYRQNGHQIR